MTDAPTTPTPFDEARTLLAKAKDMMRACNGWWMEDAETLADAIDTWLAAHAPEQEQAQPVATTEQVQQWKIQLDELVWNVGPDEEDAERARLTRLIADAEKGKGNG